jgi:hypothetical protein
VVENVILRNWSVRGYNNTPYTAPECQRFCLHGEAYGHSHFPDGSAIETSPIQASAKKLVRTRNTVYILGEPDVSYMLWCEENGIKIDSENPIKIRDIK